MKKISLLVIVFLINIYFIPSVLAKTLECGVTQTEYITTDAGKQVVINWGKYLHRIKNAKNKILFQMLNSLDHYTPEYSDGMWGRVYVKIEKDGEITTKILQEDCPEFNRALFDTLAWHKMAHTKVLQFPKYTEFDAIEFVSNLCNDKTVNGYQDGTLNETVQVNQ